MGSLSVRFVGLRLTVKPQSMGTAADMDCARECAENNIPPAIAVKEKDEYRLVLVEEGKLKKPPDTWLQYIGKQVRVAGRLRSADGKQFIALDELTVTGEGILAQESAAHRNATRSNPQGSLRR